ncbi:phenylacetate--CoA ligase family protein [Streptomyces sp. NPDC050121]|uniref:phenylacetate--CoA ligase family protein n=1 Tax=Streptomyces sp. NPDC050121 TaxID=3365601 RepID=UPI0037B0D0CD
MSTECLTELVEFARRNSPYYRDRYAAVKAGGPHHLEDLPVIDQDGFWSANTPRNNGLLTSRQSDGIVFRTGGTTSNPKLTVYTRSELHAMARLWGDGYAAAGLRTGDRVANLFYAGELYASFLFNVLCLQETFVPVVHLPIGGTPSPEAMAEMMAEHEATVVMSTPTTLSRVAAHLVARGESLSSVHLFLFAGEAFYEDQRPLIAKAFPHADVRSLGYASVDAGVLAAPVAGETDARVHRVHHLQKLLEIVDEHTGEPIREPGRSGLLVATDLVRRLMPVIRYPVGDVAEWVDYEDRRFRLLGRSETGARVGPITVYLEDLRALVEEVSDDQLIAGIQAVQCRRDSKDELVLRIAGSITDPERFAACVVARFDELRPMFGEHVSAGLINPLRVEYVPLEQLQVNPRSGKIVRLVDQRLDRS